MDQPKAPSRLHLWRFVRGDEPSPAFEQWAYQDPTLQTQLGADLHLALISTDFYDAEAVWSLRERLGSYLRSLPGPRCRCVRLRDRDIVDMGSFNAPAPVFEQDREWSHEDVMDTLAEVRRRGEPRWWLWAARCTACDQAWLVGSEERQNDLYCLRRLDEKELRAIEDEDRWPQDFDSYERLLHLGREAGRRVRFADPLDSSLDCTMADLARARPGIKVGELASLLNLDIDLAAELARRAERQGGVTISFDEQSSG
ncbi:ChaN family lipoprotein [Engelhardtia mirabilis]|uniref:Uncharacterized protein n=1 Tax=Engelhardtia mirabilis TaxID=2528011 RepID=A0A518BM62_9BACT|nr:hypothetical protein Pla133_31560 [Planctomycetes bacterium Pla133]QDV02390.1 hypothetical protein Pla86_31550 [Planctomycetes bacterium Pla86]